MKNRKLLLGIILGAMLAPYGILAGGRVLLGVRQGADGANGATGAAYTFTYGTYTATGTTQATCTPITTNVANVTAGDNKAVCLPNAGSVSVGDVYEVLCSVAANPGGFVGASAVSHTCLVFPAPSGTTISPLSANAADTMPAQSATRYRFKGSSKWAAEVSPMKTATDGLVLGDDNVTVYGALHVGQAGGYSQIILDGDSGSQIIFTQNANPGNLIRIPNNTADAFHINISASSINPMTFVTTTNAAAIQHSVPLWGATGTVAAAGTNQSNATAIAVGSVMVTVTGCDGTKGVTLPSGSTATAVRIMSQSSTVTNTCLVYGNNNDNDTINGGSADAAYTQIAGASLLYQTDNGTNWFTY